MEGFLGKGVEEIFDPTLTFERRSSLSLKIAAEEAIRRFFTTEDRPIKKGEIAKLDPCERAELAPECAEALGLELIKR